MVFLGAEAEAEAAPRGEGGLHDIHLPVEVVGDEFLGLLDIAFAVVVVDVEVVGFAQRRGVGRVQKELISAVHLGDGEGVVSGLFVIVFVAAHSKHRHSRKC